MSPKYVRPHEEPEPEPTVCAVCGMPLPTDASAIAHLDEALAAEEAARQLWRVGEPAPDTEPVA